MKTIYCQKHGITITSVIDGTLFKFMNAVHVSASDHWFHLKILIPIPDSSTATDSNNNKKTAGVHSNKRTPAVFLLKLISVMLLPNSSYNTNPVVFFPCAEYPDSNLPHAPDSGLENNSLSWQFDRHFLPIPDSSLKFPFQEFERVV